MRSNVAGSVTSRCPGTDTASCTAARLLSMRCTSRSICASLIIGCGVTGLNVSSAGTMRRIGVPSSVRLPSTTAGTRGSGSTSPSDAAAALIGAAAGQPWLRRLRCACLHACCDGKRADDEATGADDEEQGPQLAALLAALAARPQCMLGTAPKFSSQLGSRASPL